MTIQTIHKNLGNWENIHKKSQIFANCSVVRETKPWKLGKYSLKMSNFSQWTIKPRKLGKCSLKRQIFANWCVVSKT